MMQRSRKKSKKKKKKKRDCRELYYYNTLLYRLFMISFHPLDYFLYTYSNFYLGFIFWHFDGKKIIYLKFKIQRYHFSDFIRSLRIFFFQKNFHCYLGLIPYYFNDKKLFFKFRNLAVPVFYDFIQPFFDYLVYTHCNFYQGNSFSTF